MNRGGVETWLMQVLRGLDPARVRMEFLVTRAEPGQYDAEIRALGSSLTVCESPRSPVQFARRFLDVLRERGPYDVVHSHVHHFSGLILALARRAGVAVRIAHSHLDTLDLDSGASPLRRAYLALMRAALRRYATNGLAVSAVAARALFGPEWQRDGRWQIGRCGLDFSAFRAPGDGAAVRAELGIPADSLVLGHVGRFDQQKNHGFLLRIAAAALRREPGAVLVLVGDGPLRAATEAEAERIGIRQRVAFAGVRADVPRLLRAFDVFVLPSLREGLPLVGLEAQAAGLPIVVADSITRELEVIPELFTWLSHEDSAEGWAEAALRAARKRGTVADPVAALERSEFSLSSSLAGLLRLYRPV
jgi:glycosyltransferase involved in cell wall biosynthesis